MSFGVSTGWGTLKNPAEDRGPDLVQNGMLVGVGQTRDISEQIAAEKAVLGSPERISEDIRWGNGRNLPISLEGKYLSANPALARILDFDSAQEWFLRSMTRLIKCGLDPKERSRFTLSCGSEGPLKLRMSMERQDGTTIWVSLNARIVRDAEGQGLYYEGFVDDITESRRARESLRESMERFRELLDKR